MLVYLTTSFRLLALKDKPEERQTLKQSVEGLSESSVFFQTHFTELILTKSVLISSAVARNGDTGSGTRWCHPLLVQKRVYLNIDQPKMF